MKMLIRTCAFTIAMACASAAAANGCYADYKAKQDAPLRLHYGVVELRGACNARAATAELSARLRGSGWTLLNIVSVFGNDGLQSRRQNAGQFFLRF